MVALPFKIYFHLSFWIFGLKLFIKSSYNTLISLQSISMSIFSFLLLVNLPQFLRSWRRQGIPMSDTALYKIWSVCLISQLQWGWCEVAKWMLYMYWVCITPEEPKLKNSQSFNGGLLANLPNTYTRGRHYFYYWLSRSVNKYVLCSGARDHHYLSGLFTLQTFL